MKFFHLYLFFLFTFLLYLTPSFCKKNWLSSKSSNKLAHRKSYKQQEFPKTLGNLRQLIFPEPLIEQKKSEIEEVLKFYDTNYK